MNLKKAIIFSTITISSLTARSIENKIEGTFIVNPSKFEYPSFPKITLVNENKDTTTYYGNMVGQINYYLEPGKYAAKIEPGKDSLSNVPGDTFQPYKTNIILPSKKYLQLTPIQKNPK